MRYLSLCSGIEAATVAWRSLRWQAVAFAEIAPFPCAVLAHHYPDVRNLGDMERHDEWRVADVDLLVGGTPCQSFSVAGLRAGMADPRGNLALVYLAIAAQLRPQWLVWENVPGVMHSNGGRDFGAFIGGLGELRYGFAWRVLDAQYFGVPQRRRRVFVVGCAGSWQRAAAVLFESACLRGDSASSRATRESVAAASAASADAGDESYELIDIADPLTANEGRTYSHEGRNNFRLRNVVTACFDTTQITHPENRSLADPSRASLAESARAPAVALRSNGVRRLTPREAERLQGFPDDYTLIPFRKKPATDSARYRAIGNSMAVPVVRWLGERINFVEEIRLSSAMVSQKRDDHGAGAGAST